MSIDEFFVNLCYCYVVEKNREEFCMKKNLFKLVGGGAIVE